MRLLIAGCGGHGRVVADAADCSGLWEEISFADDGPAKGAENLPWTIAGRMDEIASLRGKYQAFAAAVGDARLRLQLLASARQAGFDLPVIVHPAAWVSRHAQLGAGTVVLAGAAINMGASLGMGCIVNTGATVDHDCRIGDAVHVCPGAHLAGEVTIGDRTWFGLGALARQQTAIGADVTVGAGAVCVSAVPDNVTVVGVPARELVK